MKKVVVAVDGSDVSKEVIDYALHYAQREKDAELLFLHVVNWEDYREVSVGGRSVSVPPSEEEAGKELGDWVQERVVSSGTPKPERMSINVLFGNLPVRFSEKKAARAPAQAA